MRDLMRRGYEATRNFITNETVQNPEELSKRLSNISLKISSEISRDPSRDSQLVSNLPTYKIGHGVSYHTEDPISNLVADIYLQYKSTIQETRVSEILKPLQFKLADTKIADLPNYLDEIVTKLNQLPKIK